MDEVQLEHRLTAIETKVELGSMQTVIALNGLTDKVGTQNGRIGKLEAWRWQAIGILSAVIVAGPFVFFILGKVWE